jgi:sugar lactone lactonase YvrE
VLVRLLYACVGPSPAADTPPETGAAPSTPPTLAADSAVSVGDTGQADRCADLPPGPFDVFTTDAVRTEEDFDFDKMGFLLTQQFAAVAAYDRTGDSHIVSPNVGVDAAGLRSMPNGDIVVAQPDTGTLVLVHYDTGATVPLLGGITFPNGLEVGRDGFVYSTEYVGRGRVRQIDPATGDATVIAELEFPNNLALSPDEQTLYVVVSTGQFGSSTSDVVALDREPGGAWGPQPRLIGHYDGLLGGITTDECGNVYVVAIRTGWVVRIDVQTGAMTTIATLPSGGVLTQYSSLRFGAGIGDWARTELFVTNRVNLSVLDVGVEGRHVLASP